MSGGTRRRKAAHTASTARPKAALDQRKGEVQDRGGRGGGFLLLLAVAVHVLGCVG